MSEEEAAAAAGATAQVSSSVLRYVATHLQFQCSLQERLIPVCIAGDCLGLQVP